MTDAQPSDLRTLHLIYIHGFRGDHTSFQAFPTDLHSYLEGRLGLGVELKSSLYPTYKSRRPISEATNHFLTWLSTQPKGDVILFGHSMGGLLAAEAAVAYPKHKSKKEGQEITGVMALDAPLLGMHPHVVISGIASLFPKKDKGKKPSKEGGDGEGHSPSEMQKDGESHRTETDMNDRARVRVVGEGEVRDMQTADGRDRQRLKAEERKDEDDAEDPKWEEFKGSLKVPPSPSVRSRASGSVYSNTSSPPLSPMASPPVSTQKKSFFDKSLNFVNRVSNDPFVQFLRKHNDDPFGAAKKQVVEHFEFGSCMFDPKGLMDRYQKLEKWNGKWMNLWTRTIVHDHSRENEEEKKDDKKDKTNSGSDDGDVVIKDDDTHLSVRPEISHRGSSASDASTATQHSTGHKHHHLVNEEKCRVVNCQTHPRHFIVLPFETSKYYSRWQMVEIAGVDDEVQAHCGIFIRTQNLEYDVFVERVGKIVIGWQKDSHSS